MNNQAAQTMPELWKRLADESGRCSALASRANSSIVKERDQRLANLLLEASEAIAALSQTAGVATSKDAAMFAWLERYPNLYTVTDLLRADQYVTLRRACESLMPTDDAPEVVQPDWYTTHSGTHEVDWDADPARQLSIMLKPDGSVSYSVLVGDQRFSGHDAMSDEFRDAVAAWAITPQSLAAAPAASGGEGGIRDAYEGAREDLLDWKGRALRAEATLRGLGYTGICADEAPQPPAGASVSERARELLAASYRESGDKAQALDVERRIPYVHHAIALRALEQALTQQRGECWPLNQNPKDGWTFDPSFLDEIKTRAEQSDIGEFAPCLEGVESVLIALRDMNATTPQPGAEALQEYITRLNEAHALAATHSLTDYEKGWSRRGKVIADELESLLARGAK